MRVSSNILVTMTFVTHHMMYCHTLIYHTRMFYDSDVIERNVNAYITLRINYSTLYVRDNAMNPVSGFARITTCIFVIEAIFNPLGKSGCDFHVMHRRRIDDRRK